MEPTGLDRLRGAPVVTQFIRFTAVGAVTTAVQYLVLWIGVALVAAPAALASAAGYALGVLLSYFLNYAFTFRSERSHLAALPRYFVVFGVGWCLNLALMGLFVHRLAWPVWPSQVLTTAVGLVWNFSASRAWTFRQNRD